MITSYGVAGRTHTNPIDGWVALVENGLLVAALCTCCQEDLSNIQEVAHALGWASCWSKSPTSLGNASSAPSGVPDYSSVKWSLGKLLHVCLEDMAHFFIIGWVVAYLLNTRQYQNII